MDKSFGTFYNKITNLFHSNSSTSSVSEVNSSTLLDRIVPTNNITPINQRRSSSRISRQISIKTNDNQIKLSNAIIQQQT
jgi:hypothetical protein